MQKHLTFLAIVFIIGSLAELLGALLLLGFGATIPFFFLDDLLPSAIAGGMITAIGVFLLLLALPGLILAWGLLQQRSWARPLGFVTGALSLFNPPLGTILGLYTFWVLLKDETRVLLASS